MFKGAIYFLSGLVLITLVTEITFRIYLLKGKKMILEVTAYDSLNNMLGLCENVRTSRQIDIVANKIHYFHPYNNSIGIRNFEFKTAYDNVASLHEGGHYLSANACLAKHTKILVSQYAIAINRLLTIPMFIVASFLFDPEKSNFILNSKVFTIALVFFILASTCRLFISLPEEYNASKLALKFIEKYYGELVVKYAKRFFLFSFLTQLASALTIILAVPLIYILLFII